MKKKIPAKKYFVVQNASGRIYRNASGFRKYDRAYKEAVSIMKAYDWIGSCIIISNHDTAVNITRRLLKRLGKLK